MFATHKHRRKHSICPNCEHILHPNDNYCPHCGQENHDLKIPLGHLLYEFVESITHFDTKLWETGKAIFTRPGKITKDFLDGKRARYVPPARMYVFVSFVFFLLLNTLFDRSIEKEGRIDFNSSEIQLDSSNYRVERRDVLAYAAMDTAEREALIRSIAPSADSTQRRKLAVLITGLDSAVHQSNNLVTEVTGDTTIKTPADLERFNTMTDEQLGQYLKRHDLPNGYMLRRLLRQSPKYAFEFNVKEFVHKALKTLSVVMFILMPVVALLLLLLYYRRSHFYYEHLIFSVHFHTIVFIGYILAILADSFANTYNFLSIMNFILIFYLYKSLRRVYGQSRKETILKFMLLSASYGVVALVSLAGVLFYSLLYF